MAFLISKAFFKNLKILIVTILSRLQRTESGLSGSERRRGADGAGCVRRRMG